MLAHGNHSGSKILAAAVALAEAEQGIAAADFCRLFYAHVPLDDISDAKPEFLHRQALSTFKLAESRNSDVSAIRVSNPSVETDAWAPARTVIEVIHDDMPFLVDSVVSELKRRGLAIHQIIHPVLTMQRASGRIKTVSSRTKAGADESIMHIHIEQQMNVAECSDIAAGLEAVLTDVRASVEDWQPIRAKVAEAIQTLTQAPPQEIAVADAQEAADFLAWMDDDHFTFLGYCEYAYAGDGDDFVLMPKSGAGLGLLREDRIQLRGGIDSMADLPPRLLSNLKTPRLINIIKSMERSVVHRPAQLDYISVQVFDEDGTVIGDRRFVGLFTSTVYTASPKRIPVVRRKVADAIAAAAQGRGSHDEKALAHILESYPRDELLQTPTAALASVAAGILNIQDRVQPALFLRHDRFERFVSALVFVPRDRYDTTLRLQIGDILSSAFDGEIMAFATHIAEDPLARVHMIVRTETGNATDIDIAALQAAVIDACQSWSDKLETAILYENRGERGRAMAKRFSAAFPAAYRESTSAAIGAEDAGLIDEFALPNGLAQSMSRPDEAPETAVHFKLFHRGGPAPLSDVMPMLEDAGLRILSETPSTVRPQGSSPVWIHHFEAETSNGRPIDLQAVKQRFHDSFSAVWHGQAESDAFNQLIFSAGLTWRQVALLRAFSRYLRQAGATFSIEYMEDTLNAQPEISQLIVAYFEARFHPNQASQVAAAASRQGIITALDTVSSLDEDRILRRFLNLADAAQRTNFWQKAKDRGPKEYISIKFDSSLIDDLPLPRPMAEIFVYSPRMEGVHLRGGKVARGGIRWSDRREDFRTEILGLMKAQMVKNTVIVPVGAKGGFVVKQPPAEGGREALQAEGVECYKTLIRGMLDVTDNIVNDAIIPPPDVIRADGDDPYIVAAADKGTATFSDIANGISNDYGFWLEDAFASGGSAGYDHKKMGITARGAWESVKRMFLELGKDIQQESFTAAGCGDMSGDVFGNGMLLSKHTKLIAAFNHMHIIIDPDPDTASSYAERKRLFEMGRSQWSDYDESLLSSGGAIFERSAKSVMLSPEAQAALGLTQAKLTPNELITAILKSEVELLWFGGIGSYIKAASESHQDAGDKANDAMRVNGNQVRAHVIGEGANLGVTQLGRVAFAETGGRINTDFIDNSAGVDASDHEVNLKILLGRMVRAGDMTGPERDALLAEMTDEVAQLILRNNYLQGQALSMEEGNAAARLSDHIRFMRTLERMGRLNRSVEFLPDDEALAARELAGQGLTRPELAILLSYAKLVLFDDLVESDLPDDPGLADMLQAYFPTAVRERFSAEITTHPLGREITATLATNEIVDRLGPSFVLDTMTKTGRTASDVARAFAITMDIFRLRDVYQRIEALDGPGRFGLQAEMFAATNRLARRAVDWLLRKQGQSLSIVEGCAGLSGPVAAISEGLSQVVNSEITAEIDVRIAEWTANGASPELARTVAQLDPLASALDIAQMTESSDGADILEAARTYFATGEALKLAWCRTAALALEVNNAWERMAADASLDDLYSHQADIARSALNAGGLPEWMAARDNQLDRLHRILEEMAQSEQPNSAMITVANGLYRSLSAA